MQDQEAAVIGAEKERKKKKRRTAAGFILLGLTAFLLLSVIGICAAAALSNTIFRDTYVMGVSMGGLTRPQAEEAWQEAKTCDTTQISLLWDPTGTDGQETPLTEVTLSEMGISITPKTAADTAWQVCHGGNLLENGWALVCSWFRPTECIPPLTVAQDVLQKRCTRLSEELNCTVVDGAWRLAEDGLYLTVPMDGRKMNGDKLYQLFSQRMSQRDLSPILCEFDQQQAQRLDIPALHEELKGAMVNSRYDRETGKASPSHIGVEFDVAAVEKELAASQPGQEFRTSAKVQFPQVSQEELQKAMFRDVLGTYTTYVSGTWSRLTNVRLAAERINGCIYNPGEEFWYNATVGQRTAERGFQAAPAYYQGHTVNEIGGGICQVSSTLYYATLLSDLKIVQRWEHQFAPAYITFGCDATVSWNGPDYAFRNNTPYPIKIVTYYSNDNNLTCTIYGTKTDDGYVKMESYTRSVENWQTVYQANEEVPLGEQSVVETPYTGYTVETYRCHYDKDGNLLDRTYEAKSEYSKRNKIIWVNPEDPILLD